MPITTKDKRFLDLAVKISKKSQHKRYHFAAVLVKGSNILSVGINKDNASPKPFTRPWRKNMNLHAEIDCLAGISKEQAKNAVIYVSGLSAQGNKILTKPCEICQTLIEAMGIKRIVFVDKSGVIKELK